MQKRRDLNHNDDDDDDETLFLQATKDSQNMLLTPASPSAPTTTKPVRKQSKTADVHVDYFSIPVDDEVYVRKPVGRKPRERTVCVDLPLEVFKSNWGDELGR